MLPISPAGQVNSRLLDDLGNLGDGAAGQGPVTRLDRVADRREVSLVVAGPELGAEEDVFELSAVWDLF